jgi:hypothetical protein
MGKKERLMREKKGVWRESSGKKEIEMEKGNLSGRIRKEYNYMSIIKIADRTRRDLRLSYKL